MKRTPLKRGKGLAQKRPAKKLMEPGELEWKRWWHGRCAVCGKAGLVLRHHIVDKNLIRRVATEEQIAAGVRWDQRNALPVGVPLPMGGNCTCHDDHAAIGISDKRIPFEIVPEEAYEFAQELLGVGPAAIYFATHYKVTRPSEES